MCSQAKEVNKATVKLFLLPQILRVNYTRFETPRWKHVRCTYAAVVYFHKDTPALVMIHHSSTEEKKIITTLLLY